MGADIPAPVQAAKAAPIQEVVAAQAARDEFWATAVMSAASAAVVLPAVVRVRERWLAAEAPARMASPWVMVTTALRREPAVQMTAAEAKAAKRSSLTVPTVRTPIKRRSVCSRAFGGLPPAVPSRPMDRNCRKVKARTLQSK